MELNIQFTNFWDVTSCRQMCINIYSTLNMEAAGSFPMLVPIYQSTHHIYLFKINFNITLSSIGEFTYIEFLSCNSLYSGLQGFWTTSIVRYLRKHKRTQRSGNWICFSPLATRWENTYSISSVRNSSPHPLDPTE
jgi:hypothetical protein